MKENKKNEKKQVEDELEAFLGIETHVPTPRTTGEDIAKNKFMAELEYRTKDRMDFSNIPSKEQLYKTFVRDVLGGKTGSLNKLSEPNSVLYSVYESVILHDKISASDFYTKYVKPCRLPISAYRMDGNTKSLVLFKKFLTEAVFNKESKQTLCERMFDDEGEFTSMNFEIAPQLTGIDSLEDTLVATAEFCATQVGGNVVILPPKSRIVNEKALSRYQKLHDRLLLDYDCVNGKNLFVRKEIIDDHNNSQTVQYDSADHYKNIIQTYFMKPSNMFSKKDMTREEFEETEQKYAKALNLLEAKMNSQTKEKFEISRLKAVVEEFENNKGMVFDTFGMGNFGVEVSKAADAISEPEESMTKKQMATVEKFENHIDDLYRELTSEDAVSKKMLKFFEIMKMQPYTFKNLCEKYSEVCGNFDKVKAGKTLEILQKPEMFSKVGFGMPKEFTTNKELNQFNMRKTRMNGDVVFDFSGDKFPKFVNDVEEYVDKKHLPETTACAVAVGRAFSEKTAHPISAEKNK